MSPKCSIARATSASVQTAPLRSLAIAKASSESRTIAMTSPVSGSTASQIEGASGFQPPLIAAASSAFHARSMASAWIATAAETSERIASSRRSACDRNRTARGASTSFGRRSIPQLRSIADATASRRSSEAFARSVAGIGLRAAVMPAPSARSAARHALACAPARYPRRGYLPVSVSVSALKSMSWRHVSASPGRARFQ